MLYTKTSALVKDRFNKTILLHLYCCIHVIAYMLRLNRSQGLWSLKLTSLVCNRERKNRTERVGMVGKGTRGKEMKGKGGEIKEGRKWWEKMGKLPHISHIPGSTS